jgi:hypothetical protein
MVVLLLAGHGLLFPLHATQPVNPDAWVLPGDEEISESPDQYLGERVEIGGIVSETSPLTVQLTHVDYHVRVTGTELEPAVGDKIRVYGTLTGSRMITAENAFVVPQRGRWYAWGISFLAGLWVLSRLVRHWTIDRSTLGFQPRAKPLTLKRALRGEERIDRGGEDA